MVLKGATLGALLTLGALGAGGWGVAWWAIAERVEAAVDEAIFESAANGLEVSCGARQRGGFPLSLSLDCRGAAARDSARGVAATLPQVHANAWLFRPRTIAWRLDGPLQVTAPGLAAPATADWRDAAGSLASGPDGPQRLVAELSEPNAQLASAELRASRASLLIEPAEADGTTRLDLTISGLEVAAGELRPPPTDLALAAEANLPPHMLLTGAANPLDELEIAGIAFLLRSGAVELAAEGGLRIDAAGLLHGQMALYLSGADELPALIASLPEDARAPANMLAGAVIAFGRPAERNGQPARRIVLDIEDGAVRAGSLLLGRLPPLRAPPFITS